MMIVTTSTITEKTIVKMLGVAKGNTIRARHIGNDILAGLKNIFGGEIEEYTKLMAEAREQALDRMVADAKAMGVFGPKSPDYPIALLLPIPGHGR